MRRCRAKSGYGNCSRPQHKGDPRHAVFIGGGSDPFGHDPQVWFQWGRDLKATYVSCRPDESVFS